MIKLLEFTLQESSGTMEKDLGELTTLKSMEAPSFLILKIMEEYQTHLNPVLMHTVQVVMGPSKLLSTNLKQATSILWSETSREQKLTCFSKHLIRSGRFTTTTVGLQLTATWMATQISVDLTKHLTIGL